MHPYLYINNKIGRNDVHVVSVWNISCFLQDAQIIVPKPKYNNIIGVPWCRKDVLLMSLLLSTFPLWWRISKPMQHCHLVQNCIQISKLIPSLQHGWYSAWPKTINCSYLSNVTVLKCDECRIFMDHAWLQLLREDSNGFIQFNYMFLPQCFLLQIH